jgi:hypothetical protein
MHLIVEEINMDSSTAKKTDLQDEAAGKGAVEDEGGQDEAGPSLSGQLGHRDQEELLKDNDTDFPEPDAEAEHSGTAAR